MVVIGHIVLRGESPLGQGAVPLRGRCLLCVGEVERRYDPTALPAAIRWGIGSAEQVGSMRYMPDPCALDGARADGEWGHRQETPGY